MSTHSASHTARGASPSARACTTVRLPSAPSTWSRASDPAYAAPNSSSIKAQKWLIRTPAVCHPGHPEPFRAPPSSERYRNRPRTSGAAGIVLSSRAPPRGTSNSSGEHTMTEPTRPSEPTDPSAEAHGASRPYTYPSPAGAAETVPGEVTLSDDPQPSTSRGGKRTGLLVGGVVTAL